MFRKARIQALVRKVQRFIKGAPRSKTAPDHDQVESNWEENINIFSQFLLKNLDENQLKTLLKSLENRGGIHTDCIAVPKGSELVSGLCRPDVLFCKILRWPELQSLSELKTLINCRNYDGSVLCGNPYHYSRTTKRGRSIRLEEPTQTHENGRDIPADGISPRISDDGFSEEEETQNEKENTDHEKANSFYTDSQFSSNFKSQQATEESSASCYEPWCSIAYWENKRRIGRIYDVTTECVNVFYELPQGDGMCIGLLDHVERSPYVDKVRKHIGFGFQLTQEHDGVWIYNRSDYSIFVSAPQSFVVRPEIVTPEIVRPEIVRPEVMRIPSGHCLHVVDFRQPLNINRNNRIDEDNKDIFCIRVSFAKGWGENYTRQFITSCPCWTEIYLRESCLEMMGRT